MRGLSGVTGWLGLLLVVGCFSDLTIPPGAFVSCDADIDCPDGLDCFDGLCRPEGYNAPPVVALRTMVTRRPPILIAVDVSDLEGDRVSLALSFTVPGQSDPLVLDVSDLSSTAEDQPHQVEWPDATTLGTSYLPGIVVEVTPADSSGAGSAVASESFAIGNDPPTIVLETPPAEGTVSQAGPRSSDVAIQLTLTDNAADLASVEIRFTTDAGTTWRRAALTFGDGSTLDTAVNGRDHVLFWQSRADSDPDPDVPQGIGLTRADLVQLELVATDSVDGIDETGPAVRTAPFEVDNTFNFLPTVELTTPSGTQADIITVDYQVIDPESDPVVPVVEFRVGIAGAWQRATPTDPNDLDQRSSSPDGVSYTFSWDSVTDFVARSQLEADVFVRIGGAQGLDGDALGPYTESLPFSVDNQVDNSNPSILVFPASGVLSGIQSGEIPITYQLLDDEGDPVDVTITLRDDADTMDLQPTAGPSDTEGLIALTSTPTGSTHTFFWNSLADTVGVSERTVTLTFTPTQTVPARTGASVTLEMTVDNGGDLNTPPTISFTGAPPTILGPFPEPLLYEVADAEGNDATVVFEQSIDRTTWVPLTIDTTAGADPDSLSTAAVINPYVSVWSVASDAGLFTGSPLLFVRGCPHDRYNPGACVELNGPLRAARERIPSQVEVDGGLEPQLQIDSSGRWHLVWRSTDSVFHAASDDGGRDWSSPVTINAAPIALGFSSAVKFVTRNGTTLDVLTFASSEQHYYRSVDGGQIWTEETHPTIASPNGLHDLAMASDDTLHGCWSGPGTYWYASATNGTWSSPTNVSNSANVIFRYCLVGAAGPAPAEVVYLDAGAQFGQGNIMFRQIGGSPRQAAGGSVTNLVGTQAADGSFYAAWAQNGDIRTARVSDNPALITFLGIDNGSPDQLAVIGDSQLYLGASVPGDNLWLVSNDGVQWSVPVSTRAAKGTVVADTIGFVARAWTNAVGVAAGGIDGDRLGRFSTADVLDTGFSSVRLLEMAADPNHTHVLVEQGDSDIYLRYSESGTLEVTEPLPVSGGQQESQGDMALGRDGTVYQVWRRPGTGSARVVFSEGPPWSAPVNLDTDGGQDFQPFIAAARDGTLHVVWATPSFNNLHSTRAPGSSVWTSPAPVGVGGEGSAKAITVADDDSVHVLLANSSNVLHTRSADLGSNWSASTVVGSVPGAFNNASVAVDSRGAVHVIYAGTELRYARSPTPGVWSATIAFPELINDRAALTVGGDDAVTIVWRNESSIREALSTDGGLTFTETVEPTAFLSDRARLAAVPGGTRLVTGGSDSILQYRVARTGHVFLADVPAPIAVAATPTTHDLVIDHDLTLRDLDVVVDVTHPDRTALTVQLTHVESGRATTLYAGTGPTRPHLAWARFDDDIVGQGAGLDVFEDEALAGTWRLEVEAAADTGTLDGWGLVVQ